jgi:carbon monoxide dehydrogenase subunit G
MEFENSFEVPLPPAEAWKVLLDIERIAPCMPGAELTEIVDKETYKGKVTVKLGPVQLSFAGQAKFEEIDEAGLKARVKARGNDAKGRGAASSIVEFRLEPVAAGTKVVVKTDLTMTGAVAQYGRGVGMIREVAGQLISQFATSLKAQLAATASPAAAAATAASASVPPPPPPPPPPAKPISGFALLLKVLWNSFRRLFGKGD